MSGMKTKPILSIAATLLSAGMSQAQQSPNPLTQTTTVQAPTCTPPEVWKHFHPESSKPLAKFLAHLGKQIDKSTGGTLSGPTVIDVVNTLPPPCPVVPIPPAPKPAPVTPKQ